MFLIETKSSPDVDSLRNPSIDYKSGIYVDLLSLPVDVTFFCFVLER